MGAIRKRTAEILTAHRPDDPTGRIVDTFLIALIIALTVFAGPVTRYLEATAGQLYAPKNYIDAVYDLKPVAPPYPGAKPTPNRILAPNAGKKTDAGAAPAKGGS